MKIIKLLQILIKTREDSQSYKSKEKLIEDYKHEKDYKEQNDQKDRDNRDNFSKIKISRDGFRATSYDRKDNNNLLQPKKTLSNNQLINKIYLKTKSRDNIYPNNPSLTTTKTSESNEGN